MADNQISRLDVQFAPFASGFCPATLNDFGTALAANLIVTPGLGFSGINIGPTSPENTSLPWFNTTANDWYYYSTTAGDWVPIDPTAVTGQVEIGSFQFWDGQCALISNFWGDRWLQANGQAVSRTAYPDYFGLVGTKWGIGDGVTTFNILNMGDFFPVGATTDTAGQATTTVSDGVTTSIERPYTTHVHAQEDQSQVGDGLTAGNSYTSIELSTLSDTTSRLPTRVLPPYKALVPLVRVK